MMAIIYNLLLRNYRKRILTLALSLMLGTFLCAQDMPPGFNRVISPSPTASELGKYGEIPVSLYTGIPDISIPLWEIKSHSLTLPISLSYHSGGTKVEEISSWVGLGWSLNAGGCITRVIRGKADDKENVGYYDHPWYSLPLLKNDINDFGPYYLPVIAYGYTNWQDFKDMAQGHIDCEPDIFYFNFNGYTGKFVFNVNKEPVIIPFQKLKIEAIPHNLADPQIVSWLITAPDGTKYYFGGNNHANEKTSTVGSSLGDPDDQTEYHSTWYLYKITSPDEVNSIYLNYDDSYDPVYYRYPITYSKTYNSIPQNSDVYGYTINLIQRKYLKRIIGTNDIIDFYHHSIYTDIDVDENYLDSIVISNYEGRIKKYRFDYDYFNTTGCGTTADYLPPCKKIKLTSIYEFPGNGDISKPPWEFEYDETPLPPRGSFAQDHWGYYNGANNANLIPDVTVENNWISPDYRKWIFNGDTLYNFEELRKINLSLRQFEEGYGEIEGEDRET